MKQSIDLVGQKFGLLTVTSKADSLSKSARWNCLCDCGNITVVSSWNIKTGHTKSCGCLMKLLASKRSSRHRLSTTKVHRAWVAMRGRCSNKNNKRYPHYGGRGITVCERWNNFENFLEDMGVPSESQSIDRIDNDGNYEPSNCRWVEHKTQCNNKRNNITVTYNGKNQTTQQWAQELGFPAYKLRRYLQRMSIEDAFKSLM